MSTNQKTSITAQGTTIEFATWVSAKFQCLKGDESRRLSLDWNLSHQMATEYAIKLEATKAINTNTKGLPTSR